jgi:hypothetical protein
MRKITQQITTAFESKQKRTIGNTHSDGNTLFLHNNAIAKWLSDTPNGKKELYISHAGWPTNTTKERLNGLSGVSINQSKGEWYLNGPKWTGDWV